MKFTPIFQCRLLFSADFCMIFLEMIGCLYSTVVTWHKIWIQNDHIWDYLEKLEVWDSEIICNFVLGYIIIKLFWHFFFPDWWSFRSFDTWSLSAVQMSNTRHVLFICEAYLDRLSRLSQFSFIFLHSLTSEKSCLSKMSFHFIPNHFTDLLPNNCISCKMLLQGFLFSSTYFSNLCCQFRDFFWDVLLAPHLKWAHLVQAIVKCLIFQHLICIRCYFFFNKRRVYDVSLIHILHSVCFGTEVFTICANYN